MKRKFITLIMVILAMHMQSQEIDNFIYWSKDYKVKPDDFRGKKLDSTDFATARSALTFEFLNIKNTVTRDYYYVFTIFERERSFTESKDSLLMEHEQLHFDIQELHARKIRKAFLELKKTKATYKDYSKIYKQYLDSVHLFHERFDRKTFKSNFQDIEQQWRVRVHKELKELEAFSVENLYGIKEENLSQN